MSLTCQLFGLISPANVANHQYSELHKYPQWQWSRVSIGVNCSLKWEKLCESCSWTGAWICRLSQRQHSLPAPCQVSQLTLHIVQHRPQPLSSDLTLPIFSHQSEKSNLILILLPANCWWAGYQVSTGGDHAPMVQCSTPGRLSAPWSGSAVTGQPIIHCTATPPSPRPRDQAAIFNLVPQPSSCALTCCSTTPANRSSSSVPCPANLVNCGKIFYNVSVPINETNLNTLLLHDRMQFNSFNELV